MVGGSDNDRLVWIDCEMTGLDLAVDELVEIAVVVTDFELRPLDPGFQIVIRPDASALEQWVRFLRPQVDLVVVVSHLGLDQDEGLTPSQVDDPNVGLPLTGVDLILGGHLHIVTNPPKIIPSSCWPVATSWWCLSTLMPIRFIVDSISDRMSCPSSMGFTGK